MRLILSCHPSANLTNSFGLAVPHSLVTAHTVTNTMSLTLQTSNHATDDDCISHLHSDVLSNILSRLPTKDAARTCILSKAWENKWTASAYSVDIGNKRPWNWWVAKETFFNTMDKVLVSSEHFRRFRLVLLETWVSPIRMQKLISDVLGYEQLECFDVNLVAKEIVYPCSLLNSTSLRELKLVQWDTSCVNVAATNCAPNLTRLYIGGVKFVNVDRTSTTVTLSFPVLETLTLDGTRWLNVNCVEIYAPSLTTFKSKPHARYDYPISYYFLNSNYFLKFFAPKLTTYKRSLGVFEDITLNGSASAFAYLLFGEGKTLALRLHKPIGSGDIHMLNIYDGWAESKISRFTAVVKHLDPYKRLTFRLDKLSQLTLSNYLRGAEQLFQLLHTMPSLKFLSLNMYSWEDCDYESMEFTPSCIVSHLEKVVLRVFLDKDPHYNLAKFLLKTAEKMKTFIIDIRTYDQKSSKVENVLSSFPRCSPVNIKVKDCSEPRQF